MPICLASWRLNFKIGLFIAILAATLSASSHMAASAQSPAAAAIANMALHTFALIVIAAIVSSFRHSFDRERYLARQDIVTGALTRPAFEQQAERLIALADTQARPLLLGYLDLDGFKGINDRFGHEAGDEVLRSFGVGGRTMLRREDCFGRMGGDEFAVLVPLPSIEAAQDAAMRLHERFTAALAETVEGVTCSMGALVVAPGEGVPLADMMRRADELMYAVKHNGKDGLRLAMAASTSDVDQAPLAGMVAISPSRAIAKHLEPQGSP